MTSKLIKCYETVPSYYFKEKFIFNFKFLVKDKTIIFQTQEDVDFVNINHLIFKVSRVC